MGLEVLYLVRHGKAEETHPKGDRHRSLSEEGRARIAALAPRARDLGFRAGLALSSPYLRAVQTRDLFAAVLSPSRSETSPVFSPYGTVPEAVNELAAWGEGGFPRIAVFSHNPFVTELAEALLVPGTLTDVTFHTPSLLALAFDQGFGLRSGRPLWILHP